MARSVDPLVVGKVIGDVIDMFVPMVELSVHYGTKQVSNGCQIKPSAASARPYVQINGSRSSLSTNDLFSLVMVDPDAPSPSEPTFREWLHWYKIVVDIPHGMDANKGKEVVEYMGPKPPTGIHRYVFVLFRQQGPIGNTTYAMSGGRNNFCTRQFAAHNHLGLPVAAVYFNSQKEPASKNR